MKIGDKVKLKEDILFFKFVPTPFGEESKSEMIKVGNKGDVDTIRHVLWYPFNKQYMISLENTFSDFIWDDQVELFNKKII